MEDKEKIGIVKIMTDEKDDTVISLFLKMSEQIVLNKLYPYETTEEKRVWVNKYDMTQCRIASYLLDKRGAEGETSHSEGGITRTYSSADIPNDLINEITPFANVLL